MTDQEAQEAHDEIIRLRAERDALLAENERLRAALVAARPYVQIEAAVRYVGRIGWVAPAKGALAAIDAALGEGGGG